ncbi:DUF4919 domain-containing protein, partial [Echinicola sediminis]
AILASNPFDLRAMNYQLYAFEQLGDKVNFEKKIIQYTILIDALISSGDGSSTENAFHVIEVNHEYQLVDILGFEFGGMQSLLEGNYDYLTLKDNDLGLEGLYFDVSSCFKALSKMNKSR